MEYRKHFRIAQSTELSDLALLGITEAKLPSDGFALVNPLEDDASACELFLEVAGFRYYAPAAPLPDALGEAVALVPEPNNPYDRNALMVLVRDALIGYINRLQVGTFLRWVAEQRVSGTVERLNGNPERPHAFIFCEGHRPRRTERCLSGAVRAPPSSTRWIILTPIASMHCTKTAAIFSANHLLSGFALAR